ncbi:MAG TPA: hypothetical protein VGQ83_09315 [Polyangia bacterium]|jgi:antitoxin component YwqK of YwqJK toxin-antitoxin module
MKPALVALLLLGAACGPSQKGPQGPASQAGDGTDSVAYDRNRCEGKNNRVVRLTTREDGKPDIWKFYATVSEGGTQIEVLVCKQVDLNHDGKVDIVTYYDQSGRVAKEEIDLDFDGGFDETVFYEAGKLVRKEYDRNHDGKTDEWAYYENEKLARIERDSKGRGRVDVWEYYEAGKLDRIGYDTTGSGSVDRWERAPEEPDEEGAAPKPAPAPPPIAPAVKK